MATEGVRRAKTALERDWQVVSAFLREHPDFIRGDEGLLADIGLRPRADNVLEFGPAALARLSAAKTAEKTARQELEEIARENYAAQAQTHAAVLDLLESRNLSDLARRLDEVATLRFGLAGARIALERPGAVPAGWTTLSAGGGARLLGRQATLRLGPPWDGAGLFGEKADVVESLALVRFCAWEPQRLGVIAFGSADPAGFTPEMGGELVTFLARVAERVAERWPIL